MRQDRIIQASIFDLFSEHEIGRELKAMSAWLDAHREVIALVAAELCRPGLKPTGRDGLPAESVLRCALLKQYRQLIPPSGMPDSRWGFPSGPISDSMW